MNPERGPRAGRPRAGTEGRGRPGVDGKNGTAAEVGSGKERLKSKRERTAERAKPSHFDGYPTTSKLFATRPICTSEEADPFERSGAG